MSQRATTTRLRDHTAALAAVTSGIVEPRRSFRIVFMLEIMADRYAGLAHRGTASIGAA